MDRRVRKLEKFRYSIIQPAWELLIPRTAKCPPLFRHHYITYTRGPEHRRDVLLLCSMVEMSTSPASNSRSLRGTAIDQPSPKRVKRSYVA